MREIAAHIARDSPEAAKAVVERIWQAGQGLCFLADRGRPGRVSGTRELMPEGLPYFLAYRVKGKAVQILRVIHTSRQWPLQ
jgi:plasmid stabilization system protein ParE